MSWMREADMQDLSEKTTEKALRDRAYQAGLADIPDTGNPSIDAAHKLALYTRTHGLQKETPQQALMGQFFLENPKATADEAAAFADKHGIIRQYGTAGTGAGGKTALTNDRQIQQDAEAHKAQAKQDHPEWTPAQLDEDRDAYVRSRKEATAPPTPNAVDTLRGKIDQADNIVSASQKQLDFLRSFKGGAGLMGKIMRGEEIASNITGAGTASDRVEFRRRVSELQEIVPAILTDRNGKPSAAAEKLVADVVAGLQAGDTGPNTIRAYEELIADIKKRQQDYRGRIEGGYDPNKASSGAPSAGAPDKKPAASADWLSAYPEK